MAYARQSNVVERLSMEQKRAVRLKAEDPARNTFLKLWDNALEDVASFARGAWMQGGKNMTLSMYGAAGIRQRVERYIEHRIGDRFKREAVDLLHKMTGIAYRWQYLSSCWVLDMATPPNITVRPRRDIERYSITGRPRMDPKRRARVANRLARRTREAWLDEPPEGGHDTDEKTGEPQTSWEHSLDANLKAWGASALAGLGMAAVRGDDGGGIARMLRLNRMANRKPEDVLDTLVRTMVNISVVDADDDVDEDWGPELTKERMWVSREDNRVCPLCGFLHGMTEDEVEDEEPGAEPGHVHNKCRCRWFFVMRPYKTLAGKELEAPGVRPDEMVVWDRKTGKPMAYVAVDFDTWRKRL